MPEELKQTDISEKAPAKPRSNSRRRKPKAEAGKEKKAAIPKEGTSEAPLELSAEPARKKSSRGGKKSAGRENRKPPVRIIPLGGLNEIGKNMTLYECGNDILIVDCGISFPDDEMLGVDLVIPDFSYVEKNRDRIRGLVVTHGHEDHIGAIPYLLKMVDIPVYATKLTACLIEGKLKEHGLLGRAKLNIVEAGDTVKLGCMSVEFIHVNHSIPDACGMAITTPAGVIVYTGDFKVDYTPIDCGVINSTNAERPGTTASERTVGASFDTLFKKSGNRRVIIATFASNVHRVQQVVDAAVKYGRKVAVSGRSMVNVVAKATEIGYLKIPEGVLIDIELINRYPDNQLVIITTGSQGEPMSALTRMALGDHRKVSVTPNDYIIISASPIPGNEKGIFRVINELMKLGAEVVYEKMYNIHVSGHACQDELKLMLGLVKPKYFIPFHGEFRHLKKHADMAISMGVPAENVFITDIGRVLETDGVDMKFTGIVPAGRVLVDGLGVGDVGSIVLRDRKHLAQDGLMVVVTTIDSATGEVIAGPDIVSRGFVYVREAEEMMAEAKRVCQKALEECRYGNVREWGAMKQAIKDQLGQYLFSKTKRNPMILPVIQEV